jgi:hypothetical protein
MQYVNTHRSGASLGVAGTKPTLFLETKKRDGKENGFSKSSSYIKFITYLKKEGS